MCCQVSSPDGTQTRWKIITTLRLVRGREAFPERKSGKKQTHAAAKREEG